MWLNGPRTSVVFDNNGEPIQEIFHNDGWNRLQEIQNLVNQYDSDIIIYEWGSSNFDRLSNDFNGTYDNDLQSDFFRASLRHFKNSISGLKGIHAYMYPPLGIEYIPNAFNPDYPEDQKFNLSNKPAANVISEYYKSNE